MAATELGANMTTILIVDDDQEMTTLLGAALGPLGHRVVTAGDGCQALEAAEREKPDLVLLDLHLPDISGFEVCAKLKNLPGCKGVPVLFLSVNGDLQNRLKGLGLGAIDFVPKPFSLAELVARVKNQLAAKKQNEAVIRAIYPANVASEIQESSHIRPRRHNNVAVLIADVVGFTAFGRAHTPEEVLENIQVLDRIFERLIVGSSLEKVNFVGDSFMAAAGLFDEASNPVWEAAQCGFEMIRAAGSISSGWRIRVGIDFGSVVSGMPGTQRSLFGLYGDPVNTAHRMQAAAVPSQVCLSQRAWLQVAEKFPNHTAEAVTVKGKGVMEVYHLADPALAAAGNP